MLGTIRKRMKQMRKKRTTTHFMDHMVVLKASVLNVKSCHFVRKGVASSLQCDIVTVVGRFGAKRAGFFDLHVSKNDGDRSIEIGMPRVSNSSRTLCLISCRNCMWNRLATRR